MDAVISGSHFYCHLNSNRNTMSKEFTLPELGENIAAADVLHVLIKKGDIIQEEQAVLEIETDKATIEVPSTISGKVKEVFVKDGEKVQVGQVIFNVDAVAEEAVVAEVAAPVVVEAAPLKSAPQKSTPAAAVATSSESQEMQLPELGENIPSADVLKVLVKVGDTIKHDDPVLEIETDKATIEVPSTVSGVVTDVFIKEGDKAKVGQVVIKVSAQVEVKAAPKAAAPKAAAPKAAKAKK